MSDKNVLITWGGWEGHEPEKVAHLIAGMLNDQGLTSDIVDTLECFDDLDAPPVRVCNHFVPMPYNEALEHETLPNKERVLKAINKVLYSDSEGV